MIVPVPTFFVSPPERCDSRPELTLRGFVVNAPSEAAARLVYPETEPVWWGFTWRELPEWATDEEDHPDGWAWTNDHGEIGRWPHPDLLVVRDVSVMGDGVIVVDNLHR